MVGLPIIETVVSVITTVMTVAGLLGLVALMFFESFGIPPLPSEIILPFAGFLVADGTFTFAGALSAALAGGLLGSFAGYAVGRWGRHLISRPNARYLKLDPRHLAAMDAWFARRGEPTVMISRLLPVVRSYISYPAGTARMEPVRFGVYTLIGATPFTVALIYAGMLLRKNWAALVPVFNLLDYVALGVIAVLALYIALRWRNVVEPGWPPRLIRSSGPPRPVEAGTPSPTDR
jgi:membrane protein DedA with SNARE-associated domain